MDFITIMILLFAISLQLFGKSSPIPEINEELSNAIKLLSEEIGIDSTKQDHFFSEFRNFWQLHKFFTTSKDTFIKAETHWPQRFRELYH